MPWCAVPCRAGKKTVVARFVYVNYFITFLFFVFSFLFLFCFLAIFLSFFLSFLKCPVVVVLDSSKVCSVC